MSIDIDHYKHLTANPMKEVVFENNPFLVQQVDKMVEDKKLSDRELDRLKLDLKDRNDEIARLREIIDKLRNGASSFKPDFGSQYLPDQKNLRDHIMGCRSDLLESAIIYRDKIASRNLRALCFRILQQNREIEKLKRRYELDNDERLRRIKKLPIDDPLFVWNQLRRRLVDWLFELFCLSHDYSKKFQK